jgi:hypothetical protein
VQLMRELGHLPCNIILEGETVSGRTESSSPSDLFMRDLILGQYRDK